MDSINLLRINLLPIYLLDNTLRPYWHTGELGENARNILCLCAYVQLVPYQLKLYERLLKSFCSNKFDNKEETNRRPMISR